MITSHYTQEITLDHNEEVSPQTHEGTRAPPNIRLVRFKPQMDSENIGVDQERVATVLFEDQNETHNPTEYIQDSINYNSTMPVDFHQLISKPYLVANFDWLPNMDFESLIFQMNFPGTFLDAAPQLKRMIENIAFWRPSFDVEIRVNGTNMHYGRLAFCWIPQGSYLDPNYRHFANVFSNRWYQVSASAQQTLKFHIPYTSPRTYNTVRLPYEQAALYCYVSVPLQIMSETASPISVSVYVTLKDPQFAGFRLTPQMAEPIKEIIKKDKVISTSLSRFSDYTSKFTTIPGLGMYASAISLLSKFGSDVAKHFGYSIPNQIEPIMPMALKQPRFATVEDKPLGYVVGPNVDATLDKDLKNLYGSEEELTVQGFASRPSLIYTGKIGVNSKGVIWAADVTPYECRYSSYLAPWNPEGFIGTPVEFVTRFADLWRGSLKYHFAFVCSQFHSCRLQLTYVPYNEARTVGEPSHSELSQAMSIVFDITKETEYSVLVPYMQPTEWLSVFNTDPNDSVGNNYRNGQLILSVVNILTAGTVPVNDIYFQVFASAGPDFQLALPGNRNLFSKGVFYSQPPMAAEDQGKFEPQGFSRLECELPSSSMECLHKQEYTSIVKKDVGRLLSRVQTSFELTSLKQLCNMTTMIYGTTTTANKAVYIRQPARFDMDLTGFPAWSYLANIMSVFRYYKGGFRTTAVIADGSVVSASCYRRYYPVMEGANFVTEEPFESVVNNPQNFGSGIVVQPRIDLSGFDTILPYNSRENCFLTTVTKSDSVLYIFPSDQSIFIHQFRIPEGSTSHLGLALGGADDFLVGFQIGIPRARVYYSAPVSTD